MCFFLFFFFAFQFCGFREPSDELETGRSDGRHFHRPSSIKEKLFGGGPPPPPSPGSFLGKKKRKKIKKEKENPFAPSFSLISFAFSLSLSLCVSFVAGKQRTNNSPIFFSNNPFYLFYYSIDFLFRFFFLSSREVSCAFFSCFFFLFLFFLFLFFLFFFPVALEEFPHKMFRQFKVEKGVGLG